MNYTKIGSIEATFLILVAILNHIVLNLPKNLLDACGSSTPLNIIYISILLFIFLYFVIKLFKKFTNSDIVDVSEFLGGKLLRNIIGILYIGYFTIISSTLLRNFCEILRIVYFPKIPIYFLVIAFLLVAVIANHFGSNTIVKANLIIVPLVMINLLIAFFCVAARFVPEKIFPILGYGFNETFISGATNIFAFTGISYIYFLLPMLKESKNFKSISFIGIGISTLYVFLSVISLLFSFSDVLSINEISPIYFLVRSADFGRFLQRPDAIFFLGWILCLMSYLSISILFITKIFKKIGNLKDRKPIVYISAVLIFIIALLINNFFTLQHVANAFYKYGTLILIFGIFTVILISANIKKKILSSKKNSNLKE